MESAKAADSLPFGLFGQNDLSANALGTYGVDIYAEWTSAHLSALKQKDLVILHDKLGAPDTWLVAVVSEQAKDTDRLLWVLELARQTMATHHYTVLPVRYDNVDWNPPPAFLAWPRIEASNDDLVIVRPDTPYHLPLRRWLRPSA